MTDDSEEIFRRAAESYPLKTDNPDWESVLKKMDSEPPPPDNEAPAKRKNRRWLLLLLLLIPFIIVEYKYAGLSGLFRNEKNNGEKNIAAAEPLTEAKKVTGENTDSQTNAPVSSQSSNASTDKTIIAQEPVNADKPTVDQNDHSNKTNVVNQHSDEPVVKNNPAITASDNPSVQPKARKKKTNEHNLAATHSEEQIFAQRNIRSSTKGKSNFKTTAGELETDEENTAAVPQQNQSATANNIDRKITAKNNTTATREDVQKNELLEKIAQTKKIKEESSTEVARQDVTKNDTDTKIRDKNNTPETTEDIQKKDLLEKIAQTKKIKEEDSTKTTDKTVAKKEEKKKSKEKHFYVGLIAGPDFSSIKLQSVKNTGLSYGIIAGYQVNKRFAVETGFLMDKKYYSSKGQYFSTAKLPMPSYAEILHVEGDCKMFEIPVNVYYTFSRKATSSWFGSAGISSYLMQKEFYTFDVKRYNVVYPYSSEYKSKDNQFAAVVNLSAGYTHKIGKIGDVRIEPYVKLPIGKVGTGDLPIQSAGLIIGFTRKLF